MWTVVPAGITAAADHGPGLLPQPTWLLPFFPALLGATESLQSAMEGALFFAEITGVNPAPAYGGSSSLPTAFFEMCPGFTG